MEKLGNKLHINPGPEGEGERPLGPGLTVHLWARASEVKVHTAQEQALGLKKDRCSFLLLPPSLLA